MSDLRELVKRLECGIRDRNWGWVEMFTRELSAALGASVGEGLKPEREAEGFVQYDSDGNVTQAYCVQPAAQPRADVERDAAVLALLDEARAQMLRHFTPSESGSYRRTNGMTGWFLEWEGKVQSILGEPPWARHAAEQLRGKQ